jgi:regulator of protease activity HflC (stomatin/prohibitin superfamily)
MQNPKSIKILVGIFIIVIAIIAVAFAFVEKVPEGKVAVVYSPNGGATDVLNPGWHLIGLFDKTQVYPTRIAIITTKVSVTTNDGKKITMPARYEMKVDKSKVLSIFKELGSQDIEQIQEGYLYQKLFKSSRSTVSQYSVLDIFGTKTTEASGKVTEAMAESCEELGFIITDVTLGNPEVDKATQAAIDERVKAAQQLEKLNLEKQIATAEAEKLKIEAEGKATAEIAEAKGTAEANRILQESITEPLLRKMEMEARLKHGWVTIQGSTTPIVNTQP